MMYLTELRPLSWTTEATATATAPTSFTPPVRFVETPEAFEIRLEIPGIDPEAIDLILTNGELTITGQKPEPTPGETDIWHLQETTWGSFERTFTFPTQIASDQIEAETKLGILTIKVAKAPQAISRKIPINIIQ